MTLEHEFELKLIETYKVAAKHGYHATYFSCRGAGERGGVGTVAQGRSAETNRKEIGFGGAD